MVAPSVYPSRQICEFSGSSFDVRMANGNANAGQIKLCHGRLVPNLEHAPHVITMLIYADLNLGLIHLRYVKKPEKPLHNSWSAGRFYLRQ
jgi:hypothetical protein